MGKSGNCFLLERDGVREGEKEERRDERERERVGDGERNRGGMERKHDTSSE